jgi:guanine nucleotide-binding protein subunit alpha
VRLEEERKAKSVSDAIDAEIASERESKKAKKGLLEAKVLLLGQAESGKSTLQKQFQLLYAPKSLEGERSSWKLVIFLNIVRAVKQVLEALDEVDVGTIRSHTLNSSDREIAALRLRISPILTMESSLATALTGGIQLSSSTPEHGFYSRMGWQWRSGNSRSRRSFTNDINDGDICDNSKVLTPMEHILVACGQDICELWGLDVVRLLIRERKLRLHEWSE